jgi:hypothetical protein
LEHRASNPVSVKNLTAIETSTVVKLLRPYVPVGTKTTRRRRRISRSVVFKARLGACSSGKRRFIVSRDVAISLQNQ